MTDKNPIVVMKGITIEFPGVKALDGVDLTLYPGEVHALMGENGAGKSTMIKALTGVYKINAGSIMVDGKPQQFNGTLDAQNAGIATVYQEVNLCTNLSVGENVMLGHEKRGPFGIDWKKTHEAAKKYLAQMGLESIDPHTPLSSISIAMQQLVAIARAMVINAKVLILDEPTNHLDMRSKDVLKDALREFDGTVIVVSHDREFLDGLVDKVYEFGNQKVVEHLGGIYNFLEHKKMDSLRELERSTGTSTSMSGTGEAQVSHNKLSYEARKELSKVIKKAEKAVAEAEARISELENGIAVIEAKLATPEGASDASLYGEYSALKKELSDAMDLWTERTMELEELNTQDS